MPLLNVFITVDTEHSIGGAFLEPTLKPVGNDKRIYGRFAGREYGIPLIMDIADRYDIPLTFFVEVLNKYYFGEQETREVCRYILDRGHDVQLHLHPNFLNFKEQDPRARRYGDNMSSYSLDQQAALIAEGRELLTRYCGHAPVAFRAGNYGADRNTLKALAANGFRFDSSFNAAYPAQSRRISSEILNDAAMIEGLWELPVTNFIEALPLRASRYKPFDLNGVSFPEMRSVINQAQSGLGPVNLTFVLHSFSFFKGLDAQYSRVKIRDYVVRRFENLCRFLQQLRASLRCWNLNDFADRGTIEAGVSRFVKVAPHISIARGLEQKACEF